MTGTGEMATRPSAVKRRLVAQQTWRLFSEPKETNGQSAASEPRCTNNNQLATINRLRTNKRLFLFHLTRL